MAYHATFKQSYCLKLQPETKVTTTYNYLVTGESCDILASNNGRLQFHFKTYTFRIFPIDASKKSGKDKSLSV